MKKLKGINKEKKLNAVIFICGVSIGIIGVYNGVANNDTNLALLGGGAFGISLIPMIVKVFDEFHKTL